MPIVVDPGFAWPPEVDPVVSPDGKLTAIVDPARAGVLLRADFDDSVPDTPAVPEKVLRRNLVTNPSFEDGVDGWYAAGSTITKDTSWSSSGSASLKISSTTSGVYSYASLGTETTFPWGLKPGGTYTISGTVRLTAAQTGTLYAIARRIYITYYDGSGASISFPNSTSVPNEPGEYRTSMTTTVPSNARGMTLRLENGAPTGNDIWWDDIFAEEGSTGTTYFDGSSAPSGGKRYRYASDGTSEEYTPGTPFVPGRDATVARVRFERQDGTVVRSGNPAWAPGGYAHAYDHEATLGGGTLWRAVPIRFDGTEGTPSEYVGAVIPPLSDGWAWLKPVTDPDKAMLLKVEPPDLSYDGRVDTTSIAGAPRPAATWDVLEGFTTQLRSLVREKDVEEQLMALLDEGPVLAQFPACAGLPDFYFIRGKLDLEHVHWDGWPWRRYQWDVIQIDRPDTTDSPLRIPGLSYDTVARDWTTYDQLKSTVESYNKLLEP